MLKEWICQVRPGNPYKGKGLLPEDFFRPEHASQIVFEEDIKVELFSPQSQTLIIKNKGFCAVKEHVYSRPKKEGPTSASTRPTAIHICLPHRVGGREVVFVSPNIDPLTIR